MVFGSVDCSPSLVQLGAELIDSASRVRLLKLARSLWSRTWRRTTTPTLALEASRPAALQLKSPAHSRASSLRAGTRSDDCATLPVPLQPLRSFGEWSWSGQGCRAHTFAEQLLAAFETLLPMAVVALLHLVDFYIFLLNLVSLRKRRGRVIPSPFSPDRPPSLYSSPLTWVFCTTCRIFQWTPSNHGRRA